MRSGRQASIAGLHKQGASATLPPVVRVPKAVVPVTWRLDPALYEAVRTAARAAGVSVQAFASQALAAAVRSAGTVEPAEEDHRPVGAGPTAEDHAWLDADIGGELPPYDWGPGGPPPGRPVSWIAGQGFVVEGGRDAR